MSTPFTSAAPDAPGPSSPLKLISSITDWLAKPATWIRGLSPAGSAEYDTGFISSSSGISYRRIGFLVEVVVNISGTFPVGATTVLASALPLSLMPTVSNPRGVAFIGANQTGHLYIERSTGNLGVIHQSGDTRIIAQGRIIYTLG